MGNYVTYMWREAPEIPKDKVYRFQTNDPKINRRMRRRKDFTLAAVGLNKKVWIYRTKKYSLKDAKKTLGRVTRCQINFEPSESIYTAKNEVIVSKDKHLRIAI